MATMGLHVSCVPRNNDVSNCSMLLLGSILCCTHCTHNTLAFHAGGPEPSCAAV